MLGYVGLCARGTALTRAAASIYEYFITFDLEIERVWLRRRSLVTILWIFVRRASDAPRGTLTFAESLHTHAGICRH